MAYAREKLRGHPAAPGAAEAAEDDGEPFEEKMARLTATLREQMEEGRRLDETIVENLEELGVPK